MNNKIIEEFTKLVDYIDNEINKEKDNKKIQIQKFRKMHIINAIKIIKKLDFEIEDASNLDNVKGIGKGIKTRIDEILKSGKLKEIKLKKKEKNKLNIINNLKQVIGIGEKKAIELHEDGVVSVDDLIKKVKDEKIYVNDIIKKGLDYYHLMGDNKIPRKEMEKIELLLKKIIKKIDPKLKGKLLGSYRRGLPSSNDIDFTISHKDLLTTDDLDNSEIKYTTKIVKLLKKSEYILDDLVYKPNRMYRGFFRLKKNLPVRQIDIKIVPYESYPTAILHSTGSKMFNEKLRSIAKQKGYKLNEYGLFKIKNNKEKRIEINKEKDIFDVLEIDYVSPEDRDL